MTTRYAVKTTFTLFFLLAIRSISNAQGRVVINEFLPWPGNSCGTAAEFVELLNFGPGPMNIGCYIVTDGDYSITIPPNTILQAGAFYVISGQNIIAYPCGNIDSTIHSSLNWTTCNCTSGTIPTSGNGFMTDGGSASEQVVLLDPNLKVVDAVARATAEPSSPITTSNLGGACTSKTFDLDTMNVVYETIGESAGRGNSFARKLDGDCGWLKDTQESGNATNNTAGTSSAVTYSFNYTKTQACSNDGSVAITVQASSYADVFPMSYILAYDSDSNGVFGITDSYTYNTVTNPNSIAVGNLTKGTYRLTVASVNGCYLHTFPFTILDCLDVLPLKLIEFSVNPFNNRVECNWVIENSEDLNYVIIERSSDGINFSAFSIIQAPSNAIGVWNFHQSFTNTNNISAFFRLRMISQNGNESFSSVINISSRGLSVNRIWPNPVKEQLFAESTFSSSGIVEYTVYNISNKLVSKGEVSVHAGFNSFMIPVQNLTSDVYQLVLKGKNHPEESIRFIFIKL